MKLKDILHLIRSERSNKLPYNFSHEKLSVEAGACLRPNSEGELILIFIFRGSETTKDWLWNFFAWGKDHAGFEDRFVHSGLEFWVASTLNMLVANTVNIVFLGHSAGGSLALHAHKWFQVNKGLWDNRFESSVYTVSSPKTLSRSNAKKLPRVTNIVHRKDIVPLLPFWLSNGGKKIKFGKCGLPDSAFHQIGVFDQYGETEC